MSLEPIKKKQIKTLSKKDILSFSLNQIQLLTSNQIQYLTNEQCSYFTFEQLDAFTNDQLKYFTPAQKKVDVINIITKSIDDIQKINLNVLSNNELKSLRKEQIQSLTYEQIVEIYPYIYHCIDKYSNTYEFVEGTICNFRPSQYKYFTITQIKYLTMFQSAFIPKQYLTYEQIQNLPPASIKLSRDIYKNVMLKEYILKFNKSDIENINLDTIKFISEYQFTLFTPQQINYFTNTQFHSNEFKTKYRYLTIQHIQNLSDEKIKNIDLSFMKFKQLSYLTENQIKLLSKNQISKINKKYISKLKW